MNVGAECNLACRHCHVESSPKRRERMDWATMELVLEATRRFGATTVDVTGGAPELHPNLRRFIAAARAQELHVMLRSNLTVLLRPDLDTLPDFLRTHSVHLVASLPCYRPKNVALQRGASVFDQSIRALQRLNALGYGVEPSLQLDLVYNPIGATLPPDEEGLESAYRSELRANFGVEFTRLYALTNMPIGRFAQDLEDSGRLEAYRDLLRDAFNPATLPGLMCRKQIHVGWDGRLYDCDFNFALGLTAGGGLHLRDLARSSVVGRRITTGAHCLGCTAGQGSSCGGALA